MRALILLTFLVLTFFTDAVAQEQPLQPGQRVRVAHSCLAVRDQQTRQTELRDCHTTKGSVAALSADALGLNAGDSTVSLSLRRISRIEVYRGQKAYTGVGALVGLLVGAVTGGVVGYRQCEDSFVDVGVCAAAGIGVGGGVGAGLGALTGSAIKADRWEDVPLDRLRVAVEPQRDGLGIRVSMAF
ncbi:MAG: hypothetical protein HKM89_09945 [Gemmatimonadales bacterium]|nr:hypothetical protein [Gemmatimonadales bacterium]